MKEKIRIRVAAEDAELLRLIASTIESYRRDKVGQVGTDKEEKETKKGVPPTTPFTKEEKEKEERTHTPKKIQKKVFFPSFDEVQKQGLMLGATPEQIEKFFNFYNSMEWRIRDDEIRNWQSRMKLWLTEDKMKMEQLKQQDNERRQTKGAGAKNGATREELQQEIIDYLDTHYPVADKDAEAVVAQGMERDATLGAMARVLGTAPVLRVVIKRLFVTGYAMDLKPQMLNPSTLDKTAKRLCEKGWLLTMRQVVEFLLRCMDGEYGDFRGGLKTTTVLPALRKFTMNYAL